MHSITRLITLYVLLSASLVLFGCKTTNTDELLRAGQDWLEKSRPLTEQDIAAGLKEALKVGSETVTYQLGKKDGFNHDRLFHIALPESMAKVQRELKKLGLSSYLDDLELKLNRGAEAAMPKVKQLFWQAIGDMTWQDVMQIYKGPDDAATQYFRRKMTPELKQTMQPVINRTLASAGAIQAYERVMNKYRAIPYVPDIKADLSDYVMEKSLDAMFYYVAKEEAAIRHDPVKRTTELLRRVFG